LQVYVDVSYYALIPIMPNTRTTIISGQICTKTIIIVVIMLLCYLITLIYLISEYYYRRNPCFGSVLNVNREQNSILHGI